MIGKVKPDHVSKIEKQIPVWSWGFEREDPEQVANVAVNHFFKQKDIDAFMALDNNITAVIKSHLVKLDEDLHVQMDLAAGGKKTQFTCDDQICAALFESPEYFSNDVEKMAKFDSSPEVHEFFIRCGKKFRDGVPPANDAEKRFMRVIRNTAKSLKNAR
jgi:hypothetical protein